MKKVISVLMVLIMILQINLPVISFATNEDIETENEQNQEENIYESLLTTNEQEETEVGNLTYASGVTDEMCTAEYWANKVKEKDKVLMTKTEIETLNKDIVDGAGTNVFDVTEIQEKKSALERAQILANSEEIPTRNLYINGKLIDNETYFTKLKNAMIETGFSGNEVIQKYAVAVKRADVRVWPTDDVIGYNETDPDDEIENSILNVNEPFVIRGKCEVDGKTFYWGNSNICPGWVNAENLAICKDKAEWIDSWQVDVKEKDFLVVTQDKITLEPSLTVPETSEVKLMLGTVLKLVAKSDLPENLGERGTWNNYVVYLPTRDENGNYVKQYALISQHYDVSIGFLTMTQENILKVAFSCLGNRYGWGGMLGAMDCSLYTRSIYECFGLELPRNTTWQMKTPGKVTDVSKMLDEDKEKFIEKQATGAILFFSGHAMLYTGNENGIGYVISATGSLSDSTGDLNVSSMYSVILNPLTVRRKTGKTWLNNLTCVLSFEEFEELNVDTDTTEQETITDKVTETEKNNNLPSVTEKGNNQTLNVAKTPVEVPKEEKTSDTTNNPVETEKYTDTKITTMKSLSPKTGDSIVVWISLFIVSTLGIFVTTKFIRKINR